MSNVIKLPGTVSAVDMLENIKKTISPDDDVFVVVRKKKEQELDIWHTGIKKGTLCYMVKEAELYCIMALKGEI